MSPVVRVRALARRFTVKGVLANVDLEIDRGEFVALLGRSGSGKSTLLRALAGIDFEATGDGVIEVPERISVVFQDARLLPWMRVLDNVILGLNGSDAKARGAAALTEVELGDRARAWPHELSGGEQQRVALARALVREPELLLADEPFGALDALTREQMNVELHRIWQETGTSVLFVTHSIPEAFYLANRVVVTTARPGKIAEIFPVDLPTERNYAQTMSSSTLADLGGRARALLGATAHTE
jgi:sulfonate transport system ATP-binding protein